MELRIPVNIFLWLTRDEGEEAHAKELWIKFLLSETTLNKRGISNTSNKFIVRKK